MNRLNLLSTTLVFVTCLGLCTMGFQCSSPNIASGKLYYQQYESSKDTSKLNLALQMFQKEVNEKPNSAEAWYWLGFVYGIKKEYLRLQEAWEKSKKLGPEMTSDISANTPYFWSQAFNYGATTFKKAQIKKDKSLYKEAAQSFHAANRLLPDTSAKYGGYVNYAYALVAQGKNDEALEPLKEQNKFAPNPDAYRMIAQIYTDKGNQLKKDGNAEEANKNYDLAITTLNEALVKFPEEADLNQELLNIYIASNRLLEARPKFKEYADKNPTEKTAQYAYGTVLLEAKEYEEAASYLQKALEIDPKFENALYNISLTYLRWGIKIREAEDPTKADKTGQSYKAIIEKAVPYIQKLVELSPNSIANWDLAGRVYASVGMTKEAEEAYKKADELRKGN